MKSIIPKKEVYTHLWNGGKTWIFKPMDLANQEMVYMGVDVKVRCVFCAATFEAWKKDDAPETKHHQQSPECPKLKFIEGSNVEKGITIFQILQYK